MIAALIYVAVFESVTLDSEYNTKRYQQGFEIVYS